MLDSQSSESWFESPFATASKIGHFRSLHWHPSLLTCMNEYLAIDSGGNVSDIVVARNCCMARMFPGEAELVSEWTGLPGEAKSVKRFEQSNGLDTALYKKNYLHPIYAVSFNALSGVIVPIDVDSLHIPRAYIFVTHARTAGVCVVLESSPNASSR